MVDINSHVSVITLKVNSLSTPKVNQSKPETVNEGIVRVDKATRTNPIISKTNIKHKVSGKINRWNKIYLADMDCTLVPQSLYVEALPDDGAVFRDRAFTGRDLTKAKRGHKNRILIQYA